MVSGVYNATATPLDTHALHVGGSPYTLDYALGDSSNYNVVFDSTTGTEPVDSDPKDADGVDHRHAHEDL